MSISSIFEAVMLVCFASGWPFSIAKTLRTKQVAGKSPMFMVVVETGYVAGILYKLTGTPDPILAFYVFNSLLVAVDLALYVRYRPRGGGGERRPEARKN